MKNLYFLVFMTFFILTSCGGKKAENTKPSIEELQLIISQKEDSLRSFQTEGKKIPNEKHYALIQSLLDFYQAYPNDKNAPVCLDKMHMSYSGMGVYHKSIEIADLILKKYPKYINRAMILESQASNHDIFNLPRDTVKVRYYYSLLLTENPKLDKDKKDGIEMRLKHLDLKFDEYIDLTLKEASMK